MPDATPTPPQNRPPTAAPPPKPLAPPPSPVVQPAPDWWVRAVLRTEVWLNRPFARTLCWLAVILVFVAFGRLWMYLSPEVPVKQSAAARLVSLHDAGGVVAFVVAWVDPFTSFLLAYPLFPLVILFFWLVSWGGLGRGLGMGDLVWPDSWVQRFWVGVAVSLLFANLLFVRYVLESAPGVAAAPNFGPSPSLMPFEGEETGVRRLGTFYFWTLIPALLIFYVPKTASPTYRRLLKQGRYFPATAIGLLAGVVITITLFYIDSHYGFSKGVVAREPFVKLFDAKKVLPMERELHIRAMVMACIPVFFGLVFLFQSRLGAVWSPVWSICLLVAFVSSMYGFVAFYLNGVQYIVLAGVIAVTWVCNRSMPYKMTFPGLERYRLDPPEPAMPGHAQPIVPKPEEDTAERRSSRLPPLPRVDLDAAPGKPRPAAISSVRLLERFAANWQQGPGRGTGTLPKLVLFAVSGGGIRAAVWTAAVLEGLEDEIPGGGTSGAFRDHIRLFTGASGGMVGAALYAADFERPPAAKTPERLSAMLARDSLWPTIQTMLFTDLPSIAVPWSIGWDRGRSLEAAWADNTRPYGSNDERPGIFGRAWRIALGRKLGPDSPLERSFEELHALEADARRPSLLFSPMLVEDCRRVLITNLEVSALTQSHCPSLNRPIPGSPPPEVQSIEALDFFRYFPEAYKSFQVGTAARMSATFPFVGPGVSLPTDPPRRVVDAGYFDNFGVNLAALWLLENKEAVKRYTSGVVLVEVHAYPRRAEKVQFRSGDGKGDLLAWGVSEVSTPAEAILNLYARGAYFRNDQLLELVAQVYDQKGTSNPFFTTVAMEYSGSSTLSWTMPAAEADGVMQGFRHTDGTLHEGVSHEVAKLKQWFGNGGGLKRNWL